MAKMRRLICGGDVGCGSGPRLLMMLGMTTSFMLVELIVGHFTNSIALVADAFHMMSDVIALIIAFISFKMSPKNWSKNTYGWARAEVVGALINSVFLVAMCFSITVDAIKRFLEIEEIEDPELVMIVGGVGLGINLVGLLLFHDVGHGHSHEGNHGHSHSGGSQMNITGVFLHVLADALGSVVVLISASVIRFTEWEYRFYLDPVLSLVIVIIICISTWPLLRDSTLVLLNSIPPHIDLMDLEKRLVDNVKEVLNIHELHVWRLVGRRVVASCHLEVSPPVDDHMSVAREVKEFFHKEGIHSTTIQLEYSPGSGLCQLVCPSPTTSHHEDIKIPSAECLESSCCRERPNAGGRAV